MTEDSHINVTVRPDSIGGRFNEVSTVGVSSSQGSCFSRSAPNFQCDLGALKAGASAKITLQLKVKPTAKGGALMINFRAFAPDANETRPGDNLMKTIVTFRP